MINLRTNYKKNTGRQGKRKAVERIFHAAVAVGVGGISQQGV